MTKMTEVAKMAEKYENDVEKVKKAMKSVQSVKCRLKKQKSREDYDQAMREVLAQEQMLKETRDYLVPKKLTVTAMTDEQMSTLTYEETIRAIKSIQSKKCLVQYATDKLEDNVEYQSALEIEARLQEHKKTVKPLDNAISKATVSDLLEHIQNQDKKLDRDYVASLLAKMIEE